MARFCGFDFSVRQRKKYSILWVPAEDLLSAFRSGSWSKAPALRQRLLFTLGVVLVYRLGTYIPIRGVNADFMRQLLDEHRHDALGFFDVFTGGAVRRFSLFTLNIAPYLTAAGLIKRATPLVPRLKELKDQGLAGYAILDRYAMCLAALIALFVAFQVSGALEGASNAAGPAVAHPGWRFRLTCMVILVGGTLLLTWLGRLINQRGIGPGFILVGTSGLFVNLPVAIESLSGFGRSAGWPPYAVWLLLPLAVAGVTLVVFFELAQRRIPVQAPGQVRAFDQTVRFCHASCHLSMGGGTKSALQERLSLHHHGPAQRERWRIDRPRAGRKSMGCVR